MQPIESVQRAPRREAHVSRPSPVLTDVHPQTTRGGAISRERTACAPARKDTAPPQLRGATHPRLVGNGGGPTGLQRSTREENCPHRNRADAQPRRYSNGGPHSKPPAEGPRLPCPARSGPSADRATASGPVLASGGASAPVARFAGGEGLVLFLYTFGRVSLTQVAGPKQWKAWGGN